MQTNDKVYWYDLTWLCGELSVHLFTGVYTGQVSSYGDLLECQPNIGFKRFVPRELVHTSLTEAKAATYVWVAAQKKSYTDMFNKILPDLRP